MKTLRLIWYLALIYLCAIVLRHDAGAGGQSMEPHERPQATVPTKARTEGRQREIDECLKAGGLPVVLAGPIVSAGIGCAKPLED